MIAQVANAAGGALGDLLNLVPPIAGKLAILPITDGTVPLPAGPPYVAMFNPENWQTQVQPQYYEKRRPGNNGVEHGFHMINSPNLTFDLTIDGTGASGESREVLADILLLRTTILFNGVLHKPNLLIIIWGTQFFKGVVTSMDIKYTLFRPNGIPLRAVVKLSFVEQMSPDSLLRRMNLASADLTHRRQTKEHDRLDLNCHYIYRESRHYIEVARANNLTSFRKLTVGTELIYPPVEK